MVENRPLRACCINDRRGCDLHFDDANVSQLRILPAGGNIRVIRSSHGQQARAVCDDRGQ